MKIGILTTGHVPDTMKELGTFADLFRRLLGGDGFSFENFDIVDGVFPAAVTDCDGWLITGSRHAAYEQHDWIPPLEQFIRDAYCARVPVVGICFGHQIIAQAMGGTVEKFSDGFSVGRQEYDFRGERLALYAWHQDQVTVLPEGATVLAQHPHCAYAALSYDDRMLSLQPHPEFSAAFVAGLMRERGPGVVPEERLSAAKDTLALPTDSARAATMISRFFREGAQR